MNAITINNLVFTDELPTKPGWYLWTTSAERTPNALTIEGPLDDLVATELDEQIRLKDITVKGYWHRLVPAAWLEDAYMEGWRDTASSEGLESAQARLLFPTTIACKRMLGDAGT
jgi:hypothetical protein